MYHKAIDTDAAEKLPLSREAWKLLSFDNHEVVRLNMEPGDCMENHSNDWRVIIYILEGSGVLNIEGTEHPLQAHQAIAVEAEVNRFLNNTGDKTLKILVNKTMESR